MIIILKNAQYVKKKTGFILNNLIKIQTMNQIIQIIQVIVIYHIILKIMIGFFDSSTDSDF